MSAVFEQKRKDGPETAQKTTFVQKSRICKNGFKSRERWFSQIYLGPQNIILDNRPESSINFIEIVLWWSDVSNWTMICILFCISVTHFTDPNYEEGIISYMIFLAFQLHCFHKLTYSSWIYLKDLNRSPISWCLH